MKSKILLGKYYDSSGMKIARVYLEEDYEQAEKDLAMLKEHGNTDVEWKLIETEVYNK